MRKIWIIAGLLSALLLTALTLLVRYAPAVPDALDTVVAQAVAPLQTYLGAQIFLAITALGGGVGIIAVTVCFALLARLSSAQVLRLAFVLTAVAVACRVIKAFTERARPEALLWIDPNALSAFAFPSAHAASALALYGFIAVYLYRRYERRLFAPIVMLAIALLVGLSRVVLGAHHFSDVIGGFLLTGVMLATAFLLPFGSVVKKYG